MEFDIALLGPAIEALPYFIHIFQEVGRRGLGRERGKYELVRVELRKDGAGIQVYDGSTGALTAFAPEQGPISRPKDQAVTSLTVQFLTPLRLKEKGELVTLLTFPLFFDSLSRRLSLLAAFYGGNGGSNRVSPEVGLLATQTAEIQVSQNNLHWLDWERYSRRQDAAMKFGGLLGRISFSGTLGPFLPYLRLGQAVNVGQATTFGLGKYRIIM